MLSTGKINSGEYNRKNDYNIKSSIDNNGHDSHSKYVNKYNNDDYDRDNRAINHGYSNRESNHGHSNRESNQMRSWPRNAIFNRLVYIAAWRWLELNPT